MELKGNVFYISKEPINVRNAVSVPELNYERMSGEPFSINCSVSTKVSRKILRWMTLGDRRHSRFMKQIVLLKRNPKHHEAIFRCLRYGNKIPRKYKRKYKEVIKQMKMPWQR